jgi:hypothetical protein
VGQGLGECVMSAGFHWLFLPLFCTAEIVEIKGLYNKNKIKYKKGKYFGFKDFLFVVTCVCVCVSVAV